MKKEGNAGNAIPVKDHQRRSFHARSRGEGYQESDKVVRCRYKRQLCGGKVLIVGMRAYT